MKILVADNNRTITRIVKTALEEEGYTVETANSKEETLNLVNSNPDIGIVLIDTKFETDKDGYYIVKELKAVRPIQVVMLVSALEKPDLELMGELNVTSYITKPIDSRKLIQVISEIENSVKNTPVQKEEQVHVENVDLDSPKKGKQKQKRLKEIEEDETKKNITIAEDRRFDEDSAEEEKSVISHDWMVEQKEKILEDISLLFSSVREVFENIKSIEKEAQSYVKEISGIVSDLKLKIQKIPDPDRIIFEVVHQTSNEIYKKIMDQVVEKLYSDLKEDLKLLVAKEIDKFKGHVLIDVKENLFPNIESEIFDRLILKVRSILYEKIYDAVYHSIKEDFDSALDRLKRDLRNIRTIVEDLQHGEKRYYEGSYEGIGETKSLMNQEEVREEHKDKKDIEQEKKKMFQQEEIEEIQKEKESQFEQKSSINDFFSIEDI